VSARPPEEVFFEEAPPPPPPRRAPLLVVSPVVAAVVLAIVAWLLWDFAPDAAYTLSARDPIDLGGPGAYALERARENRLAQVRGELVEAVPVTVARTGEQRTVGRLAGTTLIVDRPGRGGPPVYEGRLLPVRARADYAEAVAAMRARGATLPDGWLVLRDGERPRQRWLPVVAVGILLALAAVNLRALLRSAFR
jgi:hypothetical protein